MALVGCRVDLTESEKVRNSIVSETTSDRSIEKAIRKQRLFLGIAAAVVVLSLMLQVREDQRVEFRFWPQFPMPETCSSRTWFGIDCPGCGLTRSFIYMASGDWNAAFAVNRTGWLLALTVLGQFPYRWHVLKQINAGDDVRVAPVWTSYFSYFVIVALVGNWAATMAGY